MKIELPTKERRAKAQTASKKPKQVGGRKVQSNKAAADALKKMQEGKRLIIEFDETVTYEEDGGTPKLDNLDQAAKFLYDKVTDPSSAITVANYLNVYTNKEGYDANEKPSLMLQIDIYGDVCVRCMHSGILTFYPVWRKSMDAKTWRKNGLLND